MTQEHRHAVDVVLEHRKHLALDGFDADAAPETRHLLDLGALRFHWPAPNTNWPER